MACLTYFIYCNNCRNSYCIVTAFSGYKNEQIQNLNQFWYYDYYFNIHWKFCFNTMLYMIFQYAWEPVLIQRTLIGFEAILEINTIRFFCKSKASLHVLFVVGRTGVLRYYINLVIQQITGDFQNTYKTVDIKYVNIVIDSCIPW